MTRRRILSITLGALLAVGGATTVAESYPEKPVQLVVTWPAGGRTDQVARAWAEVAARHFGQPVAVVNKPGGGGTKGTIDVQRAPADGYTLMATTIGNQVLRTIASRVPYRYDEFEAVGQITASTMSIFTNRTQPFGDARELVEHAKKHPGEVTYGAVKASMPMLAVELFARKAGVRFRHVPYAGDAASVPAALGGHVNFASASSVSAIIAHTKGGTGVSLVIFNEAPDPALPGVPTARSLGYDVVAQPWTGVVAPLGTPAPVLAKIREVFQKTLVDPQFQSLMEKIGEAILPLDHEQFRARWRSDHQALAPLMEELGLVEK